MSDKNHIIFRFLNRVSFCCGPEAAAVVPDFDDFAIIREPFGRATNHCHQRAASRCERGVLAVLDGGRILERIGLMRSGPRCRCRASIVPALFAERPSADLDALRLIARVPTASLGWKVAPP